MTSTTQRQDYRVIPPILLALILIGPLCFSRIMAAEPTLADTVNAFSQETWRVEAEQLRKMALNDPRSAYEQARQLHAELFSGATPVDEARILNLMARIEHYLALTEVSQIHAKAALQLAKKYKDPVGQAEAWLTISRNAINLADIDTHITSATQAMTVLEGVERPDLLGEAMLQMSSAYLRLGQLSECVAIATQALEIAQRVKDPLVLSYAHQGMAMALDHSGRHKEAREHYSQMLVNAQAAQSKLLEAMALLGLGSIAAHLDEIHEAEQIVRDAIDIFQTAGMPFYLGHALFQLAHKLIIQNRHREALKLFDEMLEIYQAHNNKIGLWWVHYYRSKTYRALGELTVALVASERSQALAQEIDFPLYKVKSLHQSAAISAALENYSQAYKLATEAVRLNTKLQSEKTSTEMVQLAQRYHEQSRQQQLDELTRRNQQQQAEIRQRELNQSWLLKTLILTFITLAAAALLLLRLRQSHRLLTATNSQLQCSRNELQTQAGALQSMLTTYQRAQEQIELSAKVIEQSAEGIIICDTHHEILSANNAFCEMTGYSLRELLGNNPGLLDCDYNDSDTYRHLWEQVEQVGHWQGEVWNRRRNGETFPTFLSISAVRDDAGKLTNYIGISSDISQHKEAEKHIRQLAYFDALTGLPNRALLNDRIEQVLTKAQRNHSVVALMFLDLDRFKNINDSLGHRMGDAVLIETAKRIKMAVREADTVSRLGGDEFILVLSEADNEGVAHVAEKVIQAITKPFYIANHELSVSPSIGISMYPVDGINAETLVQSADSAMYRAKQSGRNTYRFFTPEMYVHANRILQLENALRQALNQHQLQLYFQPQQEIHTGNVVGCEALLRWNHPTFGMVSPTEFVPIAEDSGQIPMIGEWVLRSAVKQIKIWERAGLPLVPVAVNLSVAQFRQLNLNEIIIQILKENSLAPKYLELELTETIPMEDPAAAIDITTRLHQSGIKLSIDDFGTGYSSLSYLKRLNIHKLKIDQSFVRDIATDPEDEEIVRAIIGLAKSLKMRTIAEGVETVEQIEILRAQGCDEIQGFYYSKPLTAMAFEQLLHRSQTQAANCLVRGKSQVSGNPVSNDRVYIPKSY